MRKWYLAMTVLGLAGLGALLLSPRGRRALAWMAEFFAEVDWNEAAQRDLERLRVAVDQLTDSLGAAF